jgi:hypothetical protein
MPPLGPIIITSLLKVVILLALSAQREETRHPHQIWAQT